VDTDSLVSPVNEPKLGGLSLFTSTPQSTPHEAGLYGAGGSPHTASTIHIDQAAKRHRARSGRLAPSGHSRRIARTSGAFRRDLGKRCHLFPHGCSMLDTSNLHVTSWTSTSRSRSHTDPRFGYSCTIRAITRHASILSSQTDPAQTDDFLKVSRVASRLLLLLAIATCHLRRRPNEPP
jgi:hypothetical protein